MFGHMSWYTTYKLMIRKRWGFSQKLTRYRNCSNLTNLCDFSTYMIWYGLWNPQTIGYNFDAQFEKKFMSSKLHHNIPYIQVTLVFIFFL